MSLVNGTLLEIGAFLEAPECLYFGSKVVRCHSLVGGFNASQMGKLNGEMVYLMTPSFDKS